MQSPFPGMDPFLENPEEFSDFHDGFIVYLQEWLRRQLPKPYHAKKGRRIWLESAQRRIGPDVHLLKDQGRPLPSPESNGGGGILTRSPSVVVKVAYEEERQTFLEIYVDEGNRVRLVAILEVLSPSNKTAGEKAQELYVKKQQEIVHSQVHLVEIDLTRSGLHTTAVPWDRLQELGAFDYHVCVHRFDHWDEFRVYPFAVRDPLPTISLPLLEGMEIGVNLQAVMERTYDAGGYGDWLRYQVKDIKPPLGPADELWAVELLSAKGFGQT